MTRESDDVPRVEGVELGARPLGGDPSPAVDVLLERIVPGPDVTHA